MTLAMTTVADLVPPRERGRYQGYFGAVFGVSSIAGPLLGGFITDALSWRWIFYVNLPIGALALAFFIFGFHRPRRVVSHRIDYAGATLLTAATVVLLLMLTWGGVQYAWSSPIIMGLGSSAIILVALLVRTERRSPEPVLAPRILQNRVFLIATGVMFLTFMGLFGASVFLPLFFQLVLGFTPARAGLMLAPMTGGVVVASFFGGRLVSRTGRYKIFPVLGLAAATLAFLAVMRAAAVEGTSLGFTEVALIILGMGFGLVMPNLMVAIQNAVLPVELGSATAASAYFRSLGGTFGVAISGAIMTARLQALHAEKWKGMARGARSLLEQGIQQIEQLPAAQKEIVIGAYRHAISTTFLLGSVVIALAFFLVLFLPELPLRTSHSSPLQK
jgi:MFS family permease